MIFYLNNTFWFKSIQFTQFLFNSSMDNEVNKDFLFIYLSGKTSNLQKQIIDEWVKNPDNEELFYKWLNEYELLYPVYLAELPEAMGSFSL